MVEDLNEKKARLEAEIKKIELEIEIEKLQARRQALERELKCPKKLDWSCPDKWFPYNPIQPYYEPYYGPNTGGYRWRSDGNIIITCDSS